MHTFILSDFPATLAFLCLAASIVSLWLPRRPSAWAYLLSVSMVLAAFSGIASATGLLLLGTAIVFIYFIASADAMASSDAPSPWHLAMQIFAATMFSILAVGIATGLLPGFEKAVLYREVQLTPDAVPYTLALNYGKAAVGVVILGFTLGSVQTGTPCWSLRSVLSIAFLTVVTVSALSIALGYTRLEPKWNALVLSWAAVNLLFVCVAEEAFFRRFLQGQLSRWLAPIKGGHLIAWLTASLLFGIAHAGGGADMMMLATVAGLGYGWVYMHTGKVEFAILAHFMVNSAHFVFLTYPRLA